MRASLRLVLVPLLAGATLVTVARDVWARCHDPTRGHLPGVDYPDRFALLRPHLTGVRLVSYVIDPDDYATLDQAAGDAAAAARAQRATFEMYLAQRALAPTLVRPEPDATWVLVNYRDRARIPADWPERGLELVADPGNGAVLFHLKGR